MGKNVGSTDRVTRVILATCLIFVADAFRGTTAIILGIVMVILIVTAVFGTCPLYRLLNINTNGKK